MYSNTGFSSFMPLYEVSLFHHKQFSLVQEFAQGLRFVDPVNYELITSHPLHIH